MTIGAAVMCVTSVLVLIPASLPGVDGDHGLIVWGFDKLFIGQLRDHWFGWRLHLEPVHITPPVKYIKAASAAGGRVALSARDPTTDEWAIF